MSMVLWGGMTTIGLLLALEWLLRWRYGFGNPLIYLPDPSIGYLLAPSQRTRRYGNVIEINQFSMRSGAISQKRPERTLRILLVGDSVANGGWWTDQAQTISALLEQSLKAANPANRFEVLNASANSWGPRNELAYLKQFGTFDAQLVVVLLNTDDLFAVAPSSLRVGRDPGYPDRKPLLALIEVVQRLWLGRELPPEPKPTGDPVTANLAALSEIETLARSRMLLAMTPLRRELGESGSRDYERVARQRLAEMAQCDRIPYLDFLPVFQAMPHPDALYHDHIHLNPLGNAKVVDGLSPTIQQMVGVPLAEES
jgi:lysophospholipase L1-like esterase